MADATCPLDTGQKTAGYFAHRRRGETPCRSCTTRFVAHQKKTQRGRDRRKPRTCETCGQTYLTARSEGRFCSLDCYHFEARQKRMPVYVGPLLATKLPPQHPAMRPAPPGTWWSMFVSGPCAWCRETFTAPAASWDTRARYCSPRCAKNATRRRRGKRFIVPPQVRAAIYERDGWRCQLCRKVVGKKYPSTHRRAPTLDHIVPRSLGGTDDPSNLQLAHRICNSMKIAEVWGDGEQMMLVSEVV